jgi:hypothetical protein
MVLNSHYTLLQSSSGRSEARTVPCDEVCHQFLRKQDDLIYTAHQLQGSLYGRYESHQMILTITKWLLFIHVIDQKIPE